MSHMLKFAVLFLLLAVGGFTAYVYAFPERIAAGRINSERERSGLVRKSIDLPDGLQYVYLEGGAQDSETLMLLHGFGANKDNFTRVARFLTPHYRVIIPDHIGFGESSHPQDADYAPPAQAQRLHALAQALGIGALHVGGSSMGGHIAATWAVAYPDQVKSLWLIGAGGVHGGPKSEVAEMIAAGKPDPMLAQTEAQYAEVFRLVMAKPPYIPRPILNVFARERIANYALEQRIRAELRSDSIEPRIQGLLTPALIVHGEKDRVIHPGAAEIYRGLLQNSMLIIMSGIGHLPMIEDPERTAKDYLEFAAKQ